MYAYSKTLLYLVFIIMDELEQVRRFRINSWSIACRRYFCSKTI